MLLTQRCSSQSGDWSYLRIHARHLELPYSYSWTHYSGTMTHGTSLDQFSLYILQRTTRRTLSFSSHTRDCARTHWRYSRLRVTRSTRISDSFNSLDRIMTARSNSFVLRVFSFVILVETVKLCLRLSAIISFVLRAMLLSIAAVAATCLRRLLGRRSASGNPIQNYY